MSEPTFTSEQLLDRATSMRECVRNAAPWGDTAAMLEFAARLVERTTWQPMKTAPKDRPILLRFDDTWPDVGGWFQASDSRGWWVAHALPVQPIGWTVLPEEPR